MIEFDINSLNNINCNELINYLLTGVKYTSKKYNDNQQSRLIETLDRIIIYGSYDSLTRDYGIRNGCGKYSCRDYASLVVSRVRSRLGSNHFDKYIRSLNGKFYLEPSVMRDIIKIYCQNELSSVLESLPMNVSMFSQHVVKDMPSIENLSFYQPSNECRKAVLGGIQTQLLTSAANINGMQAYSHVGKVRSNQEDSYYIGVHPQNEEFKIMIVADGMGGEAAGEMASNIAVREMIMWFESLPASEFINPNNDNLQRLINQKIDEINQKIDKEIFEKTGADGGTTLCFSIIKKDNILMGNIGDSKSYVIENNKLIFTNTPHNITTKLNIPDPFDRFFVNSNRVYRALGGDGFDHSCDFKQIPVFGGNEYKIILCSDGVSDCLGNDKVVEIALKSKSDGIANNLVISALNNNSNFYEEMNRVATKMNPREFAELQDYLSQYRFVQEISRGKDNATAVSTTIGSRRR